MEQLETSQLGNYENNIIYIILEKTFPLLEDLSIHVIHHISVCMVTTDYIISYW